MLARLLSGLLRRPKSLPGDSAPAASDVEEILRRAGTCAADGLNDEAIALCRQALLIEPKNVVARRVLARASLPGENYREVMRRIHAYLRPRTYLEIGVSKGETIALVDPATAAIGIDPSPKIDRPLTARTRIFAETSDDFFARHDPAAEMGGLPIELAMIDGMHHFEFALRDFINVERHCSGDSTVLIHDCYPLDELTAGRERVTEFWSGDIWKLVLCLKKYRPDLAVHTVACAPTGLTIVRKLDPASPVLAASLRAICAEFMDLPYSTLDGRKAELLNLYPNDWGRVRELLG